MPGYLCVLCVYVVADRGRCVQLWPLFPLPPVISETYPTVLSILARYWSAFIWCTVSSDTESNNIFRYEHWTYILCPVAGLQLDFHLMPSLVKYSFPCHAINLRFLIKMFLHIKGQESDFSSRYHNWSFPYMNFIDAYRLIVIPITPGGLHVLCTFSDMHLTREQTFRKYHQNDLLKSTYFLFPCKVTGIYVKICFQTRKVYVKPSTPIGDLLQWSSRNKFAPKFPLGVCGGDRLSRFTLDHTGFSLYCDSKSNVMKEAYLGAYQGVSTPHICLYWYTTALIFRPEQVH